MKINRFFALVLLFVFYLLSPLAFGQGLNDSTYVFPQIVVGGGYKTNITITNVMSAQLADVMDMSFFSQDGKSLTLNLFDPRPGQYSGECVGYNPGAFLGKSSLTLTLTSSSPTPVVGYAGVHIRRNSSGDDTARVSMQYSYLQNGSVVGQATVTSVQPVMGFGFHAVESAGVNQDTLKTGVAIVNLANGLPAHLTFKLRNANGQEVVSTSLTLPQYVQISKFVGEIIALPAGWSEGTVEVISDQPILGMTLNFAISGIGTATFSTGTTFQFLN